MNRNKINELLWDESIRINKIIWLAANSSDISQDLQNFLEDDEEDAERLLGECPTADLEEYLTELSRQGKAGYLVHVASPARREGGSFSWSECRIKWFYFELWNEEMVAKTLAAWVETLRK